MSENTKQREAVGRRRFLKGAATVAWAAPVIATLSASPAYAATCGTANAQNICPVGNCASNEVCRKNPGNSKVCECRTI